MFDTAICLIAICADDISECRISCSIVHVKTDKFPGRISSWESEDVFLSVVVVVAMPWIRWLFFDGDATFTRRISQYLFRRTQYDE